MDCLRGAFILVAGYRGLCILGSKRELVRVERAFVGRFSFARGRHLAC